ncbi:23S rRNA (pseudouridine(1915)-N(3))-methyltransferase RlmH [Altibacter sp. HG106]|uniref:23S rRNA (pseudouridine(1915)-N(3))-methyltransferase RlmH n=1 Tax=Altibacter sp. HG106 TaxID=3023937 RepID=UPI0023508BFE|nr:23S rRNA (pseudouridine(1915)-N(3))-methyltransferase RlmH [Altibacter sp. HG106]MDC7993736.1 23S rRNA (pseudouridine(1915)-N(3))-methyltransferase RlmH [Altibacter sp. HG106]
MNITLLAIGKTDDPALQELIDRYRQRLSHYVNFEFQVLPDIKQAKNRSEAQQKILEGQELLKRIQPSDQMILLDEKGTAYSSVKFSAFLQKKMNSGLKNLVFVIGGPYGFSEEVYARAQGKVALSAMTFSHQMVRLFFVEQVYRGYTILRNEPYHHR